MTIATQLENGLSTAGLSLQMEPGNLTVRDGEIMRDIIANYFTLLLAADEAGPAPPDALLDSYDLTRLGHRLGMPTRDNSDPRFWLVDILFGPYDGQKFGEPWGAVVTILDGKPAFDRSCGSWDGSTSKGGFLVIRARPGEIICAGQTEIKDKKCCKAFGVLQPDGSVDDMDIQEAKKYWENLHAGADA